jgi:hypothetical protein
MFCFSKEAVDEGTTALAPSPSATLASKRNSQKEPASKAPVVEAQGKTAAETKAKRRKKNVQLPDISLEKHQASPSLNDVSYLLCCTFFIMLQ